MVGPPTPPPTTAAELQDEARQQQVQRSFSVVSPQLYESLFPVILDLARQSNYSALIKTAESGDINAGGDHAERLLLVAPLVLGYLIVDDLPPAFYALRRLPDPLLLMPFTKTLASLYTAVRERQYKNVYSRAHQLVELVSGPDFFDQHLAGVVGKMVAAFIDSFRERTLVLLSKAYQTLPLQLAQTCFGLANNDVLALATQAGWSYDSTSDLLTPSKTSTPAISIQRKAPSNMGTFNAVANSVARIEV